MDGLTACFAHQTAWCGKLISPAIAVLAAVGLGCCDVRTTGGASQRSGGARGSARDGEGAATSAGGAGAGAGARVCGRGAESQRRATRGCRVVLRRRARRWHQAMAPAAEWRSAGGRLQASASVSLDLPLHLTTLLRAPISTPSATCCCPCPGVAAAPTALRRDGDSRCRPLHPSLAQRADMRQDLPCPVPYMRDDQ